MRTTLTLDPDVAQMLADRAHRQRRPMKQIVNDAIRRGLSPATARSASKPYRVTPHVTKLLPGLDARSVNKLVDELAIDAFAAKARHRR